MFGKMTGKRVQVQSNRMYSLKTIVDSSVRGLQTDIGSLASKDKRSATVMIWNYHDDDVEGTEVPVEVMINNLDSKFVSLTHYRIDKEHSNSYEVWKKMGSPQHPTTKQIDELEKAGQLKTIESHKKLKVTSNKVVIKMFLPRQGVSLLKMDW